MREICHRATRQNQAIVPSIEAELERAQTRLGATLAEQDAGDGTRRVYELASVSGGGVFADTGRVDGTFAIWTWPHTDSAGSEAGARAFVEAYNVRTRELHAAGAAGELTE